MSVVYNSVQSSPCASLARDDDQPKFAGGRYLETKAMIDFALALPLLVLTTPLILLLFALVRLTSHGPALYSQVRLGQGGRHYRIYKIRTMIHDCERQTGPRWSTVGDSRVTPLGRVLRRLHLDELPQLWNVLRGEMSLVGPRPERPEIATQLERVIPEYRDRLCVRPGVTGLAQVQLPPDSDIAGVRRKVACDIRYLEAMGLGLDLRILMATALKVIGVPYREIGRQLSLPGTFEPDYPAQTDGAPNLETA